MTSYAEWFCEARHGFLNLYPRAKQNKSIKGSIIMDNKHGIPSDNAGFERRKFERVLGSYIVSYAPLKKEELKFDISQTRNLSECGLSFISGRKFEKGVILKIKLRLPEFTDYVVVRAQVVNSGQLSKGPINLTSAKFIDLEQGVRDAIKRLVNHV